MCLWAVGGGWRGPTHAQGEDVKLHTEKPKELRFISTDGLPYLNEDKKKMCFADGGTKKLRSTIRRSTETGIAVEMRNRVTRQGSKDSTDGSTNSNSSDGT